jgi:hypothetical protein
MQQQAGHSAPLFPSRRALFMCLGDSIKVTHKRKLQKTAHSLLLMLP